MSLREELKEKYKNYWIAECSCGWIGSTKDYDGGGQIGDYGDVLCPECGNIVDGCDENHLYVEL